MMPMIRRLAWLTDIHLNFLGSVQIELFLESVRAMNADALVITGDIGEGNSVTDYLERMADVLQQPIFFVLGNHDFYFSSIASVRGVMSRLCRIHPNLFYLTQEKAIELTPDTVLVGHDGWADGRYGDFLASKLMLNDYLVIHELAGLTLPERLKRLNALGDEAALHLRAALSGALRQYRHVYVALHPPPYPESAWHEGQTTAHTDGHLPHFTCKAAGDVLLTLAAQHPEAQITVLCGHTHGQGEARIAPNLRVLTGGAVYGSPVVQQVFEIN
jgi:3',5'-cyclic-AMP phosphodiesterase